MADRKSAIYTVANILNGVSLAASIVLLVSISWEVADREDDILSTWYRGLQLVVCSIFFVTALFRLLIPQYRREHWFRDTIFAIASIPYINILDWSGVELLNRSERIVAFAPVIISIMATVVILEWLIEGRKRRLMAAYILTVTMFTYISALLFYDCEMGINEKLHSFGDALWWAWMNVTTVGAEIFPVTAIGKVICVLLPVVGMMFFPIFTIYVTNMYDIKHPKQGE